MSGRIVVRMVSPPLSSRSWEMPSVWVRYRCAKSQKKPAPESTQPLGGGSEGVTATGWGKISFSSWSVMCPRACIRCSTWLRRWNAPSGFVIGSSFAGVCTRPASIAACGSVRSAAFTLKYRCAAAWMPYAPRPKYTMFR
jgi:hypothetical protein